MNELSLKEVTQEHVIYSYRPEGRGMPGEIRMNFSDEEATLVSRSHPDNSNYYAFKAIDAVEKRVREKNYPLEFTQAWY